YTPRFELPSSTLSRPCITSSSAGTKVPAYVRAWAPPRILRPMRAIRVEQFGGLEVLRLVEVEDPRPAAGEVVVRLHAAGVNPVEAYVRTGQYARLPELPYTPGGDG